MKHRRPLALTAAILTCGAPAHAQSTEPAIPVGSLTAAPIRVQPGTRPRLSWSITYPSIVQDFIDVEGGNTIVPTEDLHLDVRVLGAGVTLSTGKTTYSFVPTLAEVSYDGGSYLEIFHGTNHDVQPNKIVFAGPVQKGRKIRFGGKYFYDKKWGPYFNSQSGTLNVRTLVNGDVPPTTYALHDAPTLENFIKPYLDDEGRVTIGPMDVIVFMELTHTDAERSSPGYDLQDMVLLCTFRAKKNNHSEDHNHGHGNNVDGVDADNPGKGPKKESGQAVDDEKEK